jgi:hypothetical protein
MMHVGCTGLTELEHMPDSVATTVRIPDTHQMVWMDTPNRLSQS